MKLQEKLHTNALCGNRPEVLTAIHKKELSVVLYERDIQALQKDLSVAIQQELVCRASGEIHQINSLLGSFFEENLAECQALLADIQWIISQFDAVVHAKSYRLLFSTVSSNMCRKFHTDINQLRLLCTYVGPGTLWLSEDESMRDEQNKIGEDWPIDENKVHQAGTGDVIILKGALYPEGNPALHRSPPIEETGAKRLLLRLDINESLGF